MALPTFVRDQMLGLDDAARLREALASGDWWQVTKSSAAIATELGGTLSLVGFPIAAGIGAINRRLGQRAAAKAAQYAPVPGVQTVASPQFGFQQALPFENVRPPGRTPIPVQPVEPPLPSLQGVSQPGLPFGPAAASPIRTFPAGSPAVTPPAPSNVPTGSIPSGQMGLDGKPLLDDIIERVDYYRSRGITRTPQEVEQELIDEFARRNMPRRAPGLAPGASIANLAGRSAGQAMPTSLLSPTVPVPPRPFAQQAFPTMAEPASAVSRTFPPRPEFPLTTQPPLAEVIRRPPGINPAARGVQPPTNIGPGRVAPPGVRPGLFSMPGIAGGADDAVPPLIRNVPGSRNRPAPLHGRNKEALEVAGRVQRRELKVGELDARLRPGATADEFRPELPEVEVPEFVRIELDMPINQKFITNHLLRDTGIRTQRLDQYGNKIDAPMSVEEFFSLPKQDQESLGILLEARRKAPHYVEYLRGRKRGVTEPSRIQGMVAQERYFSIDPATGKPKTSRMPGTFHGVGGRLEKDIDEAIRRMDPLQYGTGSLGSGERTGTTTFLAKGGDTKMMRNAELQALDVPLWKYVTDSKGNTVYENGMAVVDPAYYSSIPGIKKILRNATPEQAQFIKTVGARRWYQIDSDPNVQVLTMLKHRAVGGYNGPGYDRGNGIIAIPRTTKAGIGAFEGMNVSPDRISVGTAPTRAGDAKYDLIDFSDNNMLDEGLINDEFADLIVETFEKRFAQGEGLIIPRWGVDELGNMVRVGVRRPTPKELSDLRISRGPKAKRIEGEGGKARTSFEDFLD